MMAKNTQSEASKLLPPDDVLFGQSPAMAVLKKRAEKVCQTNLPVLVYGARGTGKETLAHWIHARSQYCNGQFVKVHCAAIPSNLLESELFGYEKGAFTGAQVSKPGRVELASNGTLFLDEITDLDISLQSKLLYFLQEGRFSRLGDQTERVIEARLICSTSKELEGEIDAGRFRADLYYRISVVQLRLPTLGERREDIPRLAEYLRVVYDKQFGKESERFGPEILNYWQKHGWSGNVRELANGVARYVLIGPEAAISDNVQRKQSDATSNLGVKAGALPLKRIADEAVREMERKLILDALRANKWNRRRAAESLKISYRALIYKIRHAGIVQRSSAAPMRRRAAPGAGSEAALPSD
jgi:two-component system, NtrC family, response regulator AtoC